MEQIYERVAGCDVHRDQVTVCVRTPGPRGGVHKDKARFKTTTAGLIEMADWCRERAVELVAMEATGVYWKPSLLRPGGPLPGVAVQRIPRQECAGA
jgi:transposase